MSRPRTAVLAVSLLTALAATSCAAGIDAQTSRERTTTNAVGGAVGTITVRNVYVVGPATSGGTATVVAAFFNGGADPDTLTAVSSTSSAAGTVPASAVLQPQGSNIYDAFGGDQIRLTGLKTNLPVGGVTTLTFSFARAGDLTLGVPVETAEGSGGTPNATPTTSESGSVTPTTSATPTDTTQTSGATPGNTTIQPVPTSNASAAAGG